MKNILLLLLLVISCSSIYSQNLKAVYGAELTRPMIEPDSAKSLRLASVYSEIFSRNRLAVAQVKLVVISNKNEYQIFHVPREGALLHDVDYNLAASTLMDGQLTLANAVTKDAHYVPSSLQFVRKIDMNNVKWEITQEKKVVDGLEVIKAIPHFLNPSLEYKQLKPVSYRFAPSIPYKGWPTAYATLPGLIVELETHRVKYKLEEKEIGNFKLRPLDLSSYEVKNHQEFLDYYEDWNPQEQK